MEGPLRSVKSAKFERPRVVYVAVGFRVQGDPRVVDVAVKGPSSQLTDFRV